MAGSTKAQVAVLNPSQMHGAGFDATPYVFDGALHFHREDRSQRFQRDLGRALWLALAMVVLWIGAS